MNRVLKKRTAREIKANFFRYFALFTLIVFCMYIVVSLVDAAEIVMQGTVVNQRESNLEDGQFTVFNKLTVDEIDEIEDEGVSIEEHFSFDVDAENESTLRIFKNRSLIDLVVLDDGELAKDNNEVVLEKRYCEENDIHVGDDIVIGDSIFTVTGIGSSVDYDAPFRNLTDTAVNSEIFGTAFVTDEGYDLLKSKGDVATEDLTYAFVLNDAMTADALKDRIKNFDFDYSLVDDEYYLEMLEDTYGKKEEITESIEDLVDGVEQIPYAPAELVDGVHDLQDEAEDLLDEVFSEEPNNLTAFMVKADNQRIGGAYGDIEINRSVGLFAGVVIILLIAYVLSVFVIHQIQNESSVIGTLYAMGVKKKDLMRHYIFLPTLIAFVGGVIGTAIGLTGFGAGYQTGDSYSYYSIPEFDTVIPIYIVIYGVVMPTVVAALLNGLVINKSLSRTALSLIRNEQKINPTKDIKLNKMPFMQMFKIRQLFRERRTAFTVVAGMIISLLVFMLGFDCYVLCDSVGKYSLADTHYEYLYTYKYPTEDVVSGGEACFIKSLKKEHLGYTLDVTVMGIDDDNPYIDVKTVSGKNKIVASDSVATRYGLEVGDQIVLSDNANDMDYAFTVADIVPYSVGLTVFMDIDSMRELFDEDEDYYNAVMSDEKLDIEEGRLYSVSTKADTERTATLFVDLMRSMFIVLIVVSIIIFFIVMYLMESVMIDRGSFGISLFKIFGFNKGEVKKLYLDANRLEVVVGAFIAVPLTKAFIDFVFPMFIANVACCIHLEFTWYHYVIIFTTIFVIYEIIRFALTWKFDRITPAEVLKNRE